MRSAACRFFSRLFRAAFEAIFAALSVAASGFFSFWLTDLPDVGAVGDVKLGVDGPCGPVPTVAAGTGEAAEHQSLQQTALQPAKAILRGAEPLPQPVPICGRNAYIKKMPLNQW